MCAQLNAALDDIDATVSLNSLLAMLQLNANQPTGILTKYRQTRFVILLLSCEQTIALSPARRNAPVRPARALRRRAAHRSSRALGRRANRLAGASLFSLFVVALSLFTTSRANEQNVLDAQLHVGDAALVCAAARAMLHCAARINRQSLSSSPSSSSTADRASDELVLRSTLMRDIARRLVGS